MDTINERIDKLEATIVTLTATIKSLSENTEDKYKKPISMRIGGMCFG